MQSKAKTVKEYLASLPDDRRRAIEALRKVIAKNLDKPFKEGMQYGAIGYFLPHSKYPDGYHCDPSQPLPFAGIASQKNHIGLYLFCVYIDTKVEAAFRKDWLASGKKLDMGKACVRVKKLEDIPLDVVGRVFGRITAKDFVASYEKSLSATAKKRKTAKKSVKKTAKKATKKTVKKVAKKRTSKKTVKR